MTSGKSSVAQRKTNVVAVLLLLASAVTLAEGSGSAVQAPPASSSPKTVSQSTSADSGFVGWVRDLGRAIGMAFHDIGMEGKRVGLAIGHTAASFGKEVGQGAAAAGKDVGQAAKEGGMAIGKAVTGKEIAKDTTRPEQKGAP